MMKENLYFEVFAVEKDILNGDQLLDALTNLIGNEKKLKIVIGEGPDLKQIYYQGKDFINILEEFCRANKIAKDRIFLESGNLLQPDYWPNIFRFLGCDVLLYGQKYSGPFAIDKKITKHFGCFVGSARVFRLCLSSYLYLYHRDKTIQTFQQKDFPIDFYLKQIESKEMKNNIRQFCPVLPINKDPISADNGYINWDKAFNIVTHYNNFFLDVVCETWTHGLTFYPTEKIGRALFSKTAFMVHGSKDYLRNLKRIGYKTFGSIIDESYDSYTGEERLFRIIEQIDKIATLSLNDLEHIQKELDPIFEHNRKLYLEHSQEKIESVLL